MNFIHPYLLWGLLAVSIPVIIHLFNFRKFRRVYFTNVRFLEELKQQTRKQSQLRHILVMILRMLAIACLVLAFAQPFIPADKSSSGPESVSHVCVYIDNSFSMESLATGGPLVEIAKEKAREIAASYRSSDLFSIVTNDFEGRHQRWLSKEEFIQMVDETAVSPGVRKLSEVIGRQREMRIPAGEAPIVSYLISDFQSGMADFEEVTLDSLMTFRLVPLDASKKDNLYIDSCWFASPVHQLGQRVKLIARIVNHSGTSFEKVPLKLTVNGQQKAIASFDIASGLYIDVELPFTNHEPGIQYGTLEISDYPVIFDDRIYLVYNVAGFIPVLCINGGEESKYLNTLFGKDSAFTLVNNSYSNIDYNRLREFELIILNELKEISSGLSQELTSFISNGGTILVIPPAGMATGAFQPFLASLGVNYYLEMVKEESGVAEVDRNNPVFTDVFEKGSLKDRSDGTNTDWPKVSRYYKISKGMRTSQQPIMSLLNGQLFLSMESSGNGRVFLLAVPLEESYSNFASHAIFVPALYRIALLSAATDPLYYTIGKDDVIDINSSYISGDQTLKIVSMNDRTEFIPGHLNLNRKLNLQMHGQIRNAGHYELKNDEQVIKGLGFNYNRLESKMEFLTPADLQEKVRRYSPGRFDVLTEQGKPLGETIKDMNQGTTLWKLFIILALVFLGLEIVLLRFWNQG